MNGQVTINLLRYLIFGVSLLQASVISTGEEAVISAVEEANSGCNEQCCKKHMIFRDISGTCNNLKHPLWGSSGSQQIRLTNATYADTFGNEMRKNNKNGSLPNVRLVATTLGDESVNDSVREDKLYNHLFMTYGQFLDHDISLTPKVTDESDNEPDCCSSPANESVQKCLPIYIPKNDERRDIGQDCMQFARSRSASNSTRVPINAITSFIDGSVIYGSDQKTADSLRLKRDGLLKTTTNVFDGGVCKPLLPQTSSTCGTSCTCRTKYHKCFIAGDKRVNAVTTLTAIHTAFHRYHNSLAENIKKFWNLSSDEYIYQSTRRIVSAILQHIAYAEYLPKVLGVKMTGDNVLEENMKGDLVHTSAYMYNETLDPSVSVAFTTAAFRFGHSQIANVAWHSVKLNDTTNQYLDDPRMLHEIYFRPDDVYYNVKNSPLGVDALVLGQIRQPAQDVDASFAKSVTDTLFMKDGLSAKAVHSGLDIRALNYQRGRDHGLPGYNVYRKKCGLDPVISFNKEFKDFGNDSLVLLKKMSSVYTKPDDIDLFAAGIAEIHVPEGRVGPTFACIIKDQFQRLKYGDRFWYQNQDNETNPNFLSNEEITEVKKVTLASVLCEHLDNIDELPEDAMSLNGKMVACEELIKRHEVNVSMLKVFKNFSNFLPNDYNLNVTKLSRTTFLLTIVET